jgi:hypothetical protein
VVVRTQIDQNDMCPLLTCYSQSWNILTHYIISTGWLLSHLTTLFTTDQVICLMAVLFVSNGLKNMKGIGPDKLLGTTSEFTHNLGPLGPKGADQNFKSTSVVESAVGIATGHGLDDQGVAVQVPVGARIFTSQCRPNRLWFPSNLSNVYRGLFPRG